MISGRPLRTIWLLALLMTLGMPLLNTLYVAPWFVAQLIDSVESVAAKLCNNASRYILTDENWNDWLSQGLVPDFLAADLRNLSSDLQLVKIKIFLADGRTVYSSDLTDIGKPNGNSYFYEMVSAGKRYSKLVQKNEPSLENQNFRRDIVETYVPIMQKGRFAGAFELYTDVTAEVETMHALAWQATLIPFAVALVFLTLFSLLLLHLRRRMVAKKVAEQDLVAALDAAWQLTEELEERRRQVEFSHQALEEAHRELQAHQAQLRQQEKLRFVGQLAAGFADEFDPPLTSVVGNLTSLRNHLESFYLMLDDRQQMLGKHQPPRTDPDRELLWTSDDVDYLRNKLPQLIVASLESAECVRAILQSLKVFNLIDESRDELVSLQGCVEEGLRLIHQELGPEVRVHLELAELPPVVGSPRQLEQLVMQLLRNAAQALDGEGELKVRTWREAEAICLELTDTGRGMAAAVREQVFAPFFTSRDSGQGSGLGITIVWAILRQHQGEIDLVTAPGEGTCVTVRLPVAEIHRGAGEAGTTWGADDELGDKWREAR